MKDSNYHRVLRVSAMLLAFILVFDSGVLSETTARLSNGTQAYVATAIGVGAGVKPTELNEITAELTSRQRELDAREAALREREIDVRLNDGAGNSDYSTYVLASILFILLLLILLNYTLDYIRLRELRINQQEKTV